MDNLNTLAEACDAEILDSNEPDIQNLIKIATKHTTETIQMKSTDMPIIC